MLQSSSPLLGYGSQAHILGEQSGQQTHEHGEVGSGLAWRPVFYFSSATNCVAWNTSLTPSALVLSPTTVSV